MDTELSEGQKEIRKLLHDARSPSSVMMSFVNILQMHDYKVSPEELKELSEELTTAITQGLQKMEAQATVVIQLLK